MYNTKNLDGHFMNLSYGKASVQDGMKYEALRLGSFKTLPSNVPVSASKLADAGFYYSGKVDEVECYSCHLKLKDWGPQDDPFTVHKRYSSSCPFINNNIVDNVPLASKGPAPTTHATFSEGGVFSKRYQQIDPVSHQRSERNEQSDAVADGNPQQNQLRTPALYQQSQQHRPKATLPGTKNSINGGLASPRNQPNQSNENVPEGPRLFHADNITNPTLNSVTNNQVTAKNQPLGSQTTSGENKTTNTRSSPNQSNQSTSSTVTNSPTILANQNINSEIGRRQTHHEDTRQSLHRPDYRYERDRLQSFLNWPSNAAVKPEDLAKSGFYYTGTDDRVQCTFCRGILRNWEEGDVPADEHQRHFNQCPFLSDPAGTGNVVIGDEHRRRNNTNKNDLALLDHTMSIVTDRPVHQRYALPADRLETFADFPTNMVQKPEQFATAGFYYAGVSDHVKCFFCDGGLRNWEPNDEPWTEHARWFPRCGYLRLCKGDEYIKSVQDKFAPPQRHQRPPGMRRNVHRSRHPVDQKKVSSHMSGVIVKSVLEMGYSVEKLRKVVERRMEDLGDDFFPNAESLLDAITEYDEELKYLEVYGDRSDSTRQQPEEGANGNNEESNSNGEEQASKDGESNTGSQSKSKRKRKKNKKKNAVKPDPTSVMGNLEPLKCINDDDAKKLEEDVQKLKDERLCKVCMDEEVNVVFLKCGHLVCCSSCAPAMRHCPICRENIRGTVRVFMS